MKKRPLQLAVIAFSMLVILVAVSKYSGAGVAAVTAAFALIGAVLADFASQGVMM